MNVIASGTQTATLTTKHTLHTTTAAGVYSLLVDTTNLAIGDVVELAVNTKILTGGTARQVFMVTYAHTQSDPGKVSVPLIAPYGASFFLTQLEGTERSFDWCVTSV